MSGYSDLLEELISQRVLKPNTTLYKAFKAVDRKNFVRIEDLEDAYKNHPLHIGFGQTISQPYTVVFMLDLLDVRKGDKILEIGYGSGWQTVILSYLAGKNGKVYATEIVPGLKRFGEDNIRKYRQNNIFLYQADPSTPGLPEFAPFNKIIVGASADELPQAILDQLELNGTLVIPVKNSILKVCKGSDNKIDIDEFPGFVFVPLIL